MKITCNFILVAIAITAVYAADMRLCKGNGGGAISNKHLLKKDLLITGCKSSAKRCVFKRGEKAMIRIPFVAQTALTSLRAEVHGIINRTPAPFPLAHPEACGRSLTCPVAPNSTVVYEEALDVQSVFPKMNLRVKFELIDQNGDSQICLLFPVKLQ